MQVELTEQMARALATAARVGLEVMRKASEGTGSVVVEPSVRLNPGDTSAAYKAADVLESEMRKSVGG